MKDKKEMMDEQLKRAERGEWRYLGFILILILIMVVSVKMDSDYMLPVCMIAAPAILVCIFANERIKKKNRQMIRDAMNPEMSVLGQIFPYSRYRASAQNLEIEEGFEEHMGISILYGDYSVEDVITGKHHGTEFESCNIEFSRENDRGMVKYTVFRGPWIRIRKKLPLHEDLLVITKSNEAAAKLLVGIPTGNKAFDDQFSVPSEDMEDRKLLTSRLQEQILSLKEHSGGDIYLKLGKDGTICLAVNNGKGLYSIDDFTTPAEEILTHCKKETERLAGLLDILTEILNGFQ